ncbi:MAG TPA: dienelactone hydrolase family protein [Candidatus Eisenbacteria bacterium]|nr:dienelactone hydrolase family protein [Candidatus Eisenbacteria bacterium]
MKYITDKGSNKHLIITLHGTGGSASDLFDLAHYLDPLASKVGFQGEVNENGMRRYFKRYPQGGYDLASLKKETKKLYSSIDKYIKDNQLESYKITLLGYSNGANIAKNLLKEYKNIKIDNMLLFHPSPITPETPFKNQKGLNLFMTSGQNDPYINEVEFANLIQHMEAADMNVESFTHPLGHQLTEEEVDMAKRFLSQLGDQ